MPLRDNDKRNRCGHSGHRGGRVNNINWNASLSTSSSCKKCHPVNLIPSNDNADLALTVTPLPAILSTPIVSHFNWQCAILPFLFVWQPSEDAMTSHISSTSQDHYQQVRRQPPLGWETSAMARIEFLLPMFTNQVLLNTDNAVFDKCSTHSSFTHLPNPLRICMSLSLLRYCICNTAACQELEGKTKSSVKFEQSYHPLNDVVSYVTQSDLSIKPHTQRNLSHIYLEGDHFADQDEGDCGIEHWTTTPNQTVHFKVNFSRAHLMWPLLRQADLWRQIVIGVTSKTLVTVASLLEKVTNFLNQKGLGKPAWKDSVKSTKSPKLQTFDPCCC